MLYSYFHPMRSINRRWDLLGSLRRLSYIMRLHRLRLHTVRMTWRSFLCFSPKDTYVNIFVGNLAFGSTADDLRQLFEPYGVVDKVNVITDRDTGRAKGFGFVEMPDRQAATAAITGLQGQALAGRGLTVAEAKPREPRREPRRTRW